MFLGANLFAQSHEMYLSAPTSETYINQIVMGDTAADGSRKDLKEFMFYSVEVLGSLMM